MTVFLAPAVKTRELDFSAYVGQVSTCIVGMVGGASKGEVGKATLLTSPNEYLRIFGEPTIEDHGPMAAIQFLQKGNQLWYVREADEEKLKSASVKLSGKGDADATVADVITIEYIEKGTFGNQFSVSVVPVKDKPLEFRLTIFKGNGVYKAFDASLETSSANYVGKASDKEFKFTIKADKVTKIDEATKVAFAGGHDGLPVPIASVVGVGNRGLQAFTNANVHDINILATPGRSEDAIVRESLRICEARFDCFALIDPPQGLTPTEVVNYHNGTLTGENMPKAALDSSYGALYYPWVKVYNPHTATEEWIPPSGVVAGAFAYNDNVAEPWFAPAGLNRGRLTTVLDVEFELSEGQMDHLYGNGNAINPIINYKKNGYVLWGQRTLQREDTALNRINVRRLMLVIRKSVAASTAYLLFEQNDEFTWEQWKGMIEPFLDNIKHARGLYDFRVIMDASTVTADHIDRNEMPGLVMLKPTKSAEFIPIDFVLKPTGASFE